MPLDGFDLSRLRDLQPFAHGGYRATVDGVGGWGVTQAEAIENATANAAKREANELPSKD